MNYKKPSDEANHDRCCRCLDDGARAQGQTRIGSVADQACTEDPAVRAADPEAAKAHGPDTSRLRAAAGRAEGGARAGREDQLYGKRVTRVGTAADHVEGGPGPRRRSRRHRNERQVTTVVPKRLYRVA